MATIWDQPHRGEQQGEQGTGFSLMTHCNLKVTGDTSPTVCGTLPWRQGFLTWEIAAWINVAPPVCSAGCFGTCFLRVMLFVSVSGMLAHAGEGFT